MFQNCLQDCFIIPEHIFNNVSFPTADLQYSSSICRLDMRTNTGEYLRCTQYPTNGCQVKCRSLLIILLVERFILDRFHNRTDYKCMSVPCCCMPGSPMFLRVLRCMARTTSACPCHAAACRAVQCSFGFSDAWHGLQVHVRAMLLHMPGSPMFLRVLRCMARTTSACPCHVAACRAVQCSFGFSDAWHGLQVHVRAMLLHAGQSNVPSGSPMHGTDYKCMSVPCCCICRAVQCSFGFSDAWHGPQVHVRAMLLHAGQSNVHSGSPMHGTDYKCMSVPCCCMPGSPMFLRVLQCLARTTSPCPCHVAACRAVQCSFGFSNAWVSDRIHVSHFHATFDGDFSGIR